MFHFLLAAFTLLAAPPSALAQANTPLGNFRSLGALDNFTRDIQGLGAFGRFAALMSLIVALLTVVGGLWFVFQIIIGAIGWLGAGGDKGQVETAKKRLQNAVIGLVIVVFAYSFISLISIILGFPSLLNPYNALNQP